MPFRFYKRLTTTNYYTFLNKVVVVVCCTITVNMWVAPSGTAGLTLDDNDFFKFINSVLSCALVNKCSQLNCVIKNKIFPIRN